MIILLFVLIGAFIFIFLDKDKDKNIETSNNNTHVKTELNKDNVLSESNNSENNKDNQTKENKDIEISYQNLEDKNISSNDSKIIKEIVEKFIIAYCSVSEGLNPKTRLESVKSLMTTSLYEELNNIINVETDLATEYYVYRNINKIVVHTIETTNGKIKVGVTVFSDYLNKDLSTQIEDAPQDYTITLVKKNNNMIIDSCTENFK